MVTAVTLAYNQLPFVERAVKSMVDFKGIADNEIQYVLWDQGSPYPGVADYLKRIDTETGEWLSVQGGGFNIGVGSALNRVLEMTDSQYFFKLDDDCELLPFTLPLLVIAYALAEVSGPPLAVLSADVLGVGKGQVIAEYELGDFTLEQAWCVGGGAVLISRKVLEDVGPWRADRLYGVEDWDFGQRAINKGYISAYLKGVNYKSYCRTDESDPLIDAWKLEFFHHATDLQFDDWRKAKTFDGKGFIDKGE